MNLGAVILDACGLAIRTTLNLSLSSRRKGWIRSLTSFTTNRN